MFIKVSISEEIDARTLSCPEPLMLIRAALRRANKGEAVKLFSTDGGTARDVPQLCEHLGYTLLEHTKFNDTDCFIVLKPE